MPSIESADSAYDARSAIQDDETSTVLECTACLSADSVVVEIIELFPPPSPLAYIELTCLACDNVFSVVLDRTVEANLVLNGEPIADLGHGTLLHCRTAMVAIEPSSPYVGLLTCRCGFTVELPIHFRPIR